MEVEYVLPLTFEKIDHTYEVGMGNVHLGHHQNMAGEWEILRPPVRLVHCRVGRTSQLSFSLQRERDAVPGQVTYRRRKWIERSIAATWF